MICLSGTHQDSINLFKSILCHHRHIHNSIFNETISLFFKRLGLIIMICVNWIEIRWNFRIKAQCYWINRKKTILKFNYMIIFDLLLYAAAHSFNNHFDIWLTQNKISRKSFEPISLINWPKNGGLRKLYINSLSIFSVDSYFFTSFHNNIISN